MAEKNKEQEARPVYEIKHEDDTAVFEKDILRENPRKLSYLARLFVYVFSSAKVMCGIFLGLAVFLSILQPVIAFLWGRYLDEANLYSESMDPQASRLISLVGLAVLYWILKFLGDMANRYLYGWEDIERLSKVQDHRLQEKFQSRLFEKISRLYPDYMEVPRINDMIDRCFESMGSEWSSLQRGVIIEGYVIIAKAVSVAMVAVSLYLFHPLLCLLVLIAPIPTLYTTYVGNKLTFKFSRDNGKILREAGYYQDIMLGTSAKEVKAFNLFDFFFAKWKALADEYVVKEKRNQRNVFFLGLASGLVADLAVAAANIFAILLMARGKLSVGALGAVLALISTLMGSTSQLFGSIASFLSKKNEASQFFELIDLQEQEMGGEGKEPVEIESLEARGVSYRYPLTDAYRIRDISFTIRKGEKVAFVGENGAGKTTFVKLLTGMLEPSAGGASGQRQECEGHGRFGAVRIHGLRLPGAGPVPHLYRGGQCVPGGRGQGAQGRGDRQGPGFCGAGGCGQGRRPGKGRGRHGPLRRPVAEACYCQGLLPGQEFHRAGRAYQQPGPSGRSGGVPEIYGHDRRADGDHGHP